MINKSEETQLAVIQNDIGYIKDTMNKLDAKVSNHYVTRAEFDNKFNPIQKIVYGMVGLVLVTVFGALLSLVLGSQ